MILVYWFAADRESDDSRMTEAASADPALVAEAERLLEDAVKLRRRIHACPETGLVLPNTQRTVLEALGAC